MLRFLASESWYSIYLLLFFLRLLLMGMIRQDVKDSNDNYIAILEAYIDGKKVETIEMPYDYIKRKYDIFYNYDLEEGPHKLVIKWINPNEKYAVQ